MLLNLTSKLSNNRLSTGHSNAISFIIQLEFFYFSRVYGVAWVAGSKMGSVDCWAAVDSIFHVLLRAAIFVQLPLERNPLVFQLTAKD